MHTVRERGMYQTACVLQAGAVAKQRRQEIRLVSAFKEFQCNIDVSCGLVCNCCWLDRSEAACMPDKSMVTFWVNLQTPK